MKTSHIPWPSNWLLVDVQHDSITRGESYTIICGKCGKLQVYRYNEFRGVPYCIPCWYKT